MNNYYVIHHNQVIDQFQETSLKKATERAHKIYGTVVTVEGD